MSSAKIGNKAVAPPSNTAKRSREMAASNKSERHTKRTPANSDVKDRARGGCVLDWRGRIGNSVRIQAKEHSPASK